MAKVIKYKFLSCEINHGTEEIPDMEQVFLDKELYCETQAIFDASYPIAQKEAVGEITVDGEFDIAEPTEKERISQLEEALELILSGVTE